MKESGSSAPESLAELRRWLIEGDAVTLTLKLPSNLRDAARDEAALRGTTLSSFLREILITELHRSYCEQAPR